LTNITIDWVRVARVANAFKTLGLEGVKAFEDADPQMEAALRIARACGRLCPAVLAVNALVSYMLEVKGEEFWTGLAEHVERVGCGRGHEDVIKAVELYTRLRNRRFAGAKLGRLHKLLKCPQVTEAAVAGDLRRLWRSVSSCLEASPASKTVVFSVKMAYYGLRALGEDVSPPPDAPMPVDLRVSRVTYLSGMATPARVSGVNDAVDALMRKASLVRRVWGRVSELSRIPPLSLDAPVWFVGGLAGLGRRSSVLKALQRVGRLKRLGAGVLGVLVEELLARLPP